jgi:hypothetical protein
MIVREYQISDTEPIMKLFYDVYGMKSRPTPK